MDEAVFGPGLLIAASISLGVLLIYVAAHVALGKPETEKVKTLTCTFDGGCDGERVVFMG